jgi:hypothetical protein
MRCYYCGEDANDVYEHIPPKSLYKGLNEFQNRIAMSKDFITVPSCQKHNSETSHSDDIFAYLLCSLAMSSNYSSNVQAVQLQNLHEMFSRNYAAFKERFSALGCTIINSKGNKAFDSSMFSKDEKIKVLRKNAIKCYRGIAYVTKRNFFPDDDSISVEWASLQCDLGNDYLNEYSLDLNHFSSTIVSGSEDVFWAVWLDKITLLITYYGEVRCKITFAA